MFTDIYKNNTWKSAESRSGFGSTLEITTVIRRELPKTIKELEVKSILDLPCGDYHWIKETQLGVDNYIGGDIVAELVANNNKQYGKSGVSFLHLNLLSDKLPEVDMLFCRDCLVHLSFEDNQKAMANIKSGKIKYLMVTTFPNVKENENIITGRWRKLNLELPPFSFPKPIILVNENNAKDDNLKSMGVWRVEDIEMSL